MPARSASEWKAHHDRHTKRASLVAATLEAEAGKHDKNSEEHLAHAIAAQWHRSQERKHQADADEMQLAIDCTEAGFPPEILSTYEIDKAKRLWDESKTRAA